MILCWGNLAKSADDTTRIEESIQDYIEEHNSDPNAHMGEDYALGVHRLQNVLDHMPGSIGMEFFTMNTMTISFNFESFDSFLTTGIASEGMAYGRLLSNNGTGNNPAYAKTFHQAKVKWIDFTKNPIFQTTISVQQITNQIIYVACCSLDDNDDQDGFGFKIVNNILYAWWDSNGVEYTEEIQEITANTMYCLRAKISNNGTKLEFYVNGVCLYTEETHLPTQKTSHIIWYQIQHTSGDGNTMYLHDLQFQIDRY